MSAAVDMSKAGDRRRHRIERLLKDSLAQLLVRRGGQGMRINVRRVAIRSNYTIADIFYTEIDGAGEAASEHAVTLADYLAAESKSLRGQLARELNLRTTPTLNFIYDSDGIRRDELHDLLDEIAARADRIE